MTDTGPAPFPGPADLAEVVVVAAMAYPEPAARVRDHLAQLRAAVEAVWPDVEGMVRQRVADEIRAIPVTLSDARTGFEAAARVAEGGPR
jgi:hypothetical protein